MRQRLKSEPKYMGLYLLRAPVKIGKTIESYIRIHMGILWHLFAFNQRAGGCMEAFSSPWTITFLTFSWPKGSALYIDFSLPPSPPLADIDRLKL